MAIWLWLNDQEHWTIQWCRHWIFFLCLLTDFCWCFVVSCWLSLSFSFSCVSLSLDCEKSWVFIVKGLEANKQDEKKKWLSRQISFISTIFTSTISKRVSLSQHFFSCQKTQRKNVIVYTSSPQYHQNKSQCAWQPMRWNWHEDLCQSFCFFLFRRE